MSIKKIGTAFCMAVPIFYSEPYYSLIVSTFKPIVLA